LIVIPEHRRSAFLKVLPRITKIRSDTNAKVGNHPFIPFRKGYISLGEFFAFGHYIF